MGNPLLICPAGTFSNVHFIMGGISTFRGVQELAACAVLDIRFVVMALSS
jgi:hypothetical protein